VFDLSKKHWGVERIEAPRGERYGERCVEGVSTSPTVELPLSRRFFSF